MKLRIGIGLGGTVAALCLAGVALAFHGRVYVASNGCTGHAYQPTTIIIACGTGQFYVSNLKYRSYGGATAIATGRLHLDDCNPNCAQGAFRSYRGRVRLSQVAACRGRLYYDEISWRFLGRSPTPNSTGTQNIAPEDCLAP